MSATKAPTKTPTRMPTGTQRAKKVRTSRDPTCERGRRLTVSVRVPSSPLRRGVLQPLEHERLVEAGEEVSGAGSARFAEERLVDRGEGFAGLHAEGFGGLVQRVMDEVRAPLEGRGLLTEHLEELGLLGRELHVGQGL